MQQAGSYEIAASRETVWAALNDPEVLGSCIKGCQEINKVSESQFNATVKAKVGPVSATFQAELQIVDPQPPQSYTIQGGVKGGAAGFAKGAADVALEPTAAGTRLTYRVEATVGGKLAQVGSRLVDGAARKMADDFFAAFCQRLGGVASDVELAAEDASPAAASDQPSNSAARAEPVSGEARFEKSGFGFVWGVAFAVLVLAVVLAI